MSEDAMRRMCVEHPPTLVTEQPRFQPHADEFAATAGLEPIPQPLWHLDGVAWHDAEPPRRGHRHWAQTVGQFSLFRETWRCPCGAFGGPHDPWVLIDKPRVSGPPILPAALPRVRLTRPLVVYPAIAVALSIVLGFALAAALDPTLSMTLNFLVGIVLGVGSVLLARWKEDT